jgi:hypothetical protein
MTAVPQWLQTGWSHDAAEAPQSGSVEERADQLIAILANGGFEKAPHLLQALAWDLVVASFPKGQAPPKSVERLAVLALGLPPEHEAGGWDREELDKRGTPNEDACAVAYFMDEQYYRENGETMGARALSRALKEKGFKATPASIREWRKKKRLREQTTTKV